MRIAFLVNTIKTFEFKNYMSLANSVFRKGCDAHFALVDTLSLDHDQVCCDTVRLNALIKVGDGFDTSMVRTRLDEFDYVWVLSLGQRQTFLDKIQLLWLLPPDVKVINSLEAILFINSKYSLGAFSHIFKAPETFASNNFDYLWNIYDANKQDTWIVKPPAELLGRNVFILRPHDTNARALIQSMTGEGSSSKYCILQRYVHEIQNGEKRIIIAGGQIIGYYKRIMAENDHRTNLHQGAQSVICDLTEAESSLCKRIADDLLNRGVCFAGIDLVFPYVLELNVINPGGINTIYNLTGEDFSDAVTDSVFSISTSDIVHQWQVTRPISVRTS